MSITATPCACSGQDPAGCIDSHMAVAQEAACCSPCCSGQVFTKPLSPSRFPQASDTRAVYRIANMDCPTEETLIRKKLGAMAGITKLEFNLMQRVLVVEHELPSTEAIEAALKAIDMTPEPLANTVPSDPAIPWKKLALGGAAAALSEIFELLQAWDLMPFGLHLQTWQLGEVEIAHLPLILAIIAIACTGLGTYKKGWIALRNRNLNINALMSVAVTGAVLIGQYPEAAMVMVLFNISEAIEALALDRARNAIKNLLALAPEQAMVLQSDNTWREMDIREIAVGSRVRVKPGERVALDGVIVAGQSSINQAPITGESMPVEKAVGDIVYAGTINESGSFEFETSAVATDTTLARIIHAVEEAQSSRAPMQRLVDQFAKYYTPAVFLTAILAPLVPPLFMAASWIESIYTGLVILVIGCPCALVISTPVSIVSGMAAATRYGILIKGGMFLEQGRKLQWLALDKTGTITHGKPQQTDFVHLGTEDAAHTVQLAASLASRSDHPVSRAIAENAGNKGISYLTVGEFAASPGQGVSGRIDGELWRLGNLRMVRSVQQSSSSLEKQIRHLEGQGKTVVALTGPHGVQGLFAVADTVKASSIEAIRELKRLGIRTIMLTGDNEHTARTIATQAGVDEVQANLLPEDKLEIIAQLSQKGLVAMAGDGINDAPALAKADIGFAMAGAGTDTAIETADVALMDDDLRKIPHFIGLSKSTYAILVQNITLAIGVKALFFALTFMGLTTMWMAVFADAGTALLVVANGLRAIRK